MTEVITLPEAKLYLRVDSDEEDTIIQLLIAAAVEAVRDEIGSPLVEPVPDRVKIAVLVHVEQLYSKRDEAALPQSAARLLFPLRTLDI